MDRANFLSIEFPYCFPLDGANLLHNEDRANLLYNWLDNPHRVELFNDFKLLF